MNTTVSWLMLDSGDVPAHDRWLSAEERRILHAISFPRRRDDWRLGRWTAKRAVLEHVAARLSSPPHMEEVVIMPSADGSPKVSLPGGLSGGMTAPTISISHRDHRAVCAVGAPGSLLGCDVEVIEPRSAAFVADYFTDDEQRLVDAAAPPLRPLLANLLWCGKEAALKALGTGLRADTRSVTVQLDLGEGSGWHPLSVRDVPSGRMFDGWWRSASGMVLAIVSLPSPATPVELSA